jgi:hypothetical protein
MRVLICGDRNWDNVGVIMREVWKLPAGSVVIHGCARGADTIAGEAAKKCGLDVLEFPAEWEKYGRAAGSIRNKQMLVEGKPDEVWAFHSNIVHSRGTLNMMQQADKAGIPAHLFKE